MTSVIDAGPDAGPDVSSSGSQPACRIEVSHLYGCASRLLGVADVAACQLLLERQVLGNPSLVLVLEDLIRWADLRPVWGLGM